MKKLIAILFSAFFALSLCLGASAAGIPKASISGEGSVIAPADRFSISFSMETKGEDQEKTAAQSVSLGEGIKKELSSFGELTPDGYYTFTDPEGTVTVCRSYTLTSKRVTEVNAVTEKLIRLGATCICSPVYSLSASDEWEEKALKLAIENAKKRAAACGIKGEPASLKDFGNSPNCCRFSQVPDSCGKVRVECRVILGFSNS